MKDSKTIKKRKRGGDKLENQSLLQGEDMKKKIFAIVLLMGTMYIVSDMLNLMLLTFVFTFLLYSFISGISKLAGRWIRLPERLIVVMVYVMILLGLGVFCYYYVPIIAQQVVDLIENLMEFKWSDYQESIPPQLYGWVSGIDIEPYLKDGGAYVMKTSKGVGTFLISMFMAFLLSFFFLWERKEISEFLKPFETGRMSFLYRYYVYFAKNFANTFGKMIQMQIVISFINSILSVIVLSLMGFTQVWGLGVMIFALGLVPVAGVFISLVPLSILALKIGGVIKLVHVLLMVAGLHAFEAYVMNPKLVSTKMKLPIFLSFSVLIVAEHMIGVWGLLIGIPLFMFLLDVARGKSNPKEVEMK
jgi:predicted PurR-regulated permease PerM